MSGRTGRARIGPRYFVAKNVAIRVEDVSNFDALVEALRQAYPDIRETDYAEWRKAEDTPCE